MLRQFLAHLLQVLAVIQEPGVLPQDAQRDSLDVSLQLGVLALEHSLSAPMAMLAAIQVVGSQLFRQHYQSLMKNVKNGNIRPL
jgi:hypothetical protein